MKIYSRFLTSTLLATMAYSAYSSAAPSPSSLSNETFDHWIIRARAVDVIPSASSSTIPVIGGHVTNISSTVIPELDFSYFFTKHIATELILGTSRHSVEATGTTLGTVKLGRVSLLPPTLNLQYHFYLGEHAKPYVGVGVNYTLFYDVNKGSNPAVTSMSYNNTFAPELQAGMDLFVYKNWLVNVDVKYIFLNTTAHVGTVVGRLSPNVRINPTLIGLGVGYRF